jgi:hypothetical protein
VNREQVMRLVAEVISRLAPRLGADGRRGRLVIAFSGATASLPETLRQCRLLVLDGYRLRLAFSAAAEQLFGSVVRESLEGFPHVDQVDSAQWLGELLESRAVLCPMLSVNTLSKVSVLTADALVPNLLLHGLFMGKPVVLARNGVDLADEGRRALGIDQATPALRQALDDRLRTVAGYGCRITDGELPAGEPQRTRVGRRAAGRRAAGRAARHRRRRSPRAPGRRGTEPVPQVASDAAGSRRGDAARRTAEPQREGTPVKRREKTTC